MHFDLKSQLAAATKELRFRTQATMPLTPLSSTESPAPVHMPAPSPFNQEVPRAIPPPTSPLMFDEEMSLSTIAPDSPLKTSEVSEREDPQKETSELDDSWKSFLSDFIRCRFVN